MKIKELNKNGFIVSFLYSFHLSELKVEYAVKMLQMFSLMRKINPICVC